MKVVCLDLEGVLIPEIWISVAKATRVKELSRTTRDEPDYDALMRYRLGILRSKGIRLKQIQAIIQKMKPLAGAPQFLNKLRSRYPVVILSDTFYEFAAPLMKKLQFPTLYCNWLQVDDRGFISGYTLRQSNGKQKAVESLKSIGFAVAAAGDSYNDLTMIQAADEGFLFKPPAKIAADHADLPVAKNYSQLAKLLKV